MSGRSQFSTQGFLVAPELLPEVECDELAAELTALLEWQQISAPRIRGGLRNVLRASARAAAVANSARIISLVSDLMGGPAFPVRAILFDKTDGANWGVPWHQDLAIAVAERVEKEGFGPWSVKEGIVHVQPPQSVLADMIAVRLHLDKCGADDGALRVLPGSHLQGELDSTAIEEWARRRAPASCEVPKGGALLMRPLLLHASSPAKNPSHRRVLHVEYAATELPDGLRWSERT